MRMLMMIKMPHDEFNEAVRDGSAQQTMERILDKTKPEATYFTELEGQRGLICVVNVNDSSEIPSLAEPWFLSFECDVEFRIAMTPEDLGRAGLDKLGKKWG